MSTRRGVSGLHLPVDHVLPGRGACKLPGGNGGELFSCCPFSRPDALGVREAWKIRKQMGEGVAGTRVYRWVGCRGCLGLRAPRDVTLGEGWPESAWDVVIVSV